uniref:Uncharacterized protein n=1 Tax=Tanacetum cinerariifolium TaxID=118510 RepID=A0A699GDQ2_TANCI|nr:hypothetical protein [Tanacetum cinerariifolium]
MPVMTCSQRTNRPSHGRPAATPGPPPHTYLVPAAGGKKRLARRPQAQSAAALDFRLAAQAARAHGRSDPGARRARHGAHAARRKPAAAGQAHPRRDRKPVPEKVAVRTAGGRPHVPRGRPRLPGQPVFAEPRCAAATRLAQQPRQDPQPRSPCGLRAAAVGRRHGPGHRQLGRAARTPAHVQAVRRPDHLRDARRLPVCAAHAQRRHDARRLSDPAARGAYPAAARLPGRDRRFSGSPGTAAQRGGGVGVLRPDPQHAGADRPGTDHRPPVRAPVRKTDATEGLQPAGEVPGHALLSVVARTRAPGART